jgi:putative flippase GtrA
MSWINEFNTSLPDKMAGPIWANCVGFLTATLFSYFANTSWSFSRSLSNQNFIRFLCVTVMGLVFAGVTARAAEWMGMAPQYGVVLVLSTMPIVNYTLHRRWTYR